MSDMAAGKATASRDGDWKGGGDGGWLVLVLVVRGRRVTLPSSFGGDLTSQPLQSSLDWPNVRGYWEFVALFPKSIF